MYVAALALTDFRSYREVDLALQPGVTAFVGPNGQGKTNLVEAVGYAATLGSHRVATDAPLVRAGASHAVVRVAVERDGRRTLVEVEITPGRSNRARVNRAPVPRAREVLGLLRTVLFAPEDLALVRGEPADRRRYLDDLLVARAPRLAAVRQDYERVLKQRNALLRSAAQAGGRRARLDLSTLDVWDSHLAAAGAELLCARLGLVDALGHRVEQAYAAVAREGAGSPGPARIAYRGSVGTSGSGPTALADDEPGTAVPASGPDLPRDRVALAALLAEALAAARPQELDRGVSLVGPHRDDLRCGLADLPVKGYASHGEGWSFALALRLAAYELLRADGGEPVLVLDDVFAELDEGRRERLADLVAGGEQVLVTAAVPADVPARLRGARYDVAGGAVRPAA